VGSKSKHLSQTEDFTTFAGKISIRLLNAASPEGRDVLTDVLREIGERYGFDRIFLGWVGADGAMTNAPLGWTRSGGRRESPYKLTDLPWVADRVLAGEVLFVGDCDQMPPEASADRAAMKSERLNAAVFMPLRRNGEIDGLLALSKHEKSDWSDEFRDEVGLIANLVAGAYRAERERARLERSEQRLRDIVENSTDLIWECDLDLNVLYTNKDLDVTVAERMHPDDLRLIREDLPEFIAKHEGWRRRLFRYRRNDGSYQLFESSSNPMFDADGRMRGFRGVDRDISGEYLAPDEILNYTGTVGALLDSISDGALFIAGETIVDCNDAASHIFEMPREALIGKKPWEISPGIQPDGGLSVDLGRAQLEKTRNGELVRFDWLHTRKDGTELFTEVAMRRIHTRVGPRVFAIVRDVTEIRRAYTDLSQREADLRHSQEVANVGSYRLTARLTDDRKFDFRALSGSEQMYELFGIRKDDDVIARFFDRVHPDDFELLAQALEGSARNKTGDVVRYRVVRPDGSVLSMESRAEVIDIDEDGYVTAFGTCKDITEWVKANSELETAVREIEALKDQLQEENLYLRDEVRVAQGFGRFVGTSASLRDVLAGVEQVAPTDVTVLVTGETGTGKELVAQSIHDLSQRKDKAMISVNCAALSVDLIESELFGHEKGAFTGAHQQRKGRFELANGGTLFLDEIGEISGGLQAKLLRVIQEGEFERLGGSETLKSDVRLITATNRDLQAEVDAGRFRADLYYRINSFPIHVPPLRERKDDIPPLVEFLTREHAKILDKPIESISARMMRYLVDQSWPGNVRELQGIIQRALITARGPVLDFVGGTARDAGPIEPTAMPPAATLGEAQRAHIVEVLERVDWVIEGRNGAAIILDLAPSSLRSRMKLLGIERPAAKA